MVMNYILLINTILQCIITIGSSIVFAFIISPKFTGYIYIIHLKSSPNHRVFFQLQKKPCTFQKRGPLENLHPVSSTPPKSSPLLSGGPCIYEKCSDRWEVAFSLSERREVVTVGKRRGKTTCLKHIPWAGVV